MSQSVVYPSTFSSKNITISTPKQLPSGAKQAYLNYGGERLVMQTAVAMSVPFGINIADKFGPPEYSVEVSFRQSEQRPEIKEFMNVIAQLDEHLVNEGVKNSVAWFRDDMPKEVVKKFYTPSLKYSKDKDTGKQLDYPPNLKLKLRKVNNDFETKFYDINGNPYKGVPVEDLLVKGVQVTAIIECAGVWFAGSKFGLTWRAKQIAIHKLPEKIADFAFKGLGSVKPAPVEDVDDDEEQEQEQEQTSEVDDDSAFRAPPQKQSVVAAVLPKASAPAPAAQTTVDDEEGDDVEPMPTPRKPVVKKKVLTKPK
jgi:hypothetical protein